MRFWWKPGYDSGMTLRRHLREWPWGLLAGLTVVVIIFVGLGYVVWRDVDGYRGQCHGQGGHIVSVRGSEVCVDRENKVIFL